MANKQKERAIGVHPDASLATAHEKRDEARILLAYGGDPSAAKKAKIEAKALSSNTFEANTREWFMTFGSTWVKVSDPVSTAIN